MSVIVENDIYLSSGERQVTISKNSYLMVTKDHGNIAFEIQLEEEIYISPIIKNIDKYNERIKIIPFYMNVQKEGVEL